MEREFESPEEHPAALPEQAVRRFRRASPLPTRVRDGHFDGEYLNAGGEQVPWNSIRFVALAIIDQMVKDSELKAGPLRKMVKKVMSGGEDKESAKDRARQTREIFLLDVFTEHQDQPFRFEATNINYKSFLDRAGYVSHHNFFRFCVQFARKLPPEVLCNPSFPAFLSKRRDQVAHYDDYHDFELEFIQQMRQNRDLVTLEGTDLSSDSWIEEWNEDE